MKHLPPLAEEVLTQWLSEASIRVSAEAISRIVSHVEWLIDTNPVINLTAIDEPMEALRLHALDSLLALQEVNESPSGLLVDLGTGGGFPGLPLAVASGRRALLIDSVAKKADALRQYVAHENLEAWVSVTGQRSEAVARQEGPAAATVTARAVAQLPSLVELARPLLAAGGVLVAMKGSPEAEEMTRGRAAAAICGMRQVGVRAYTLPVGGEHRTVVSYRVVGPASVDLPRREGMATKRPLA